MKILVKTTLLLALNLILLFTSCQKEKLDIDGLPIASKEGKNTFGCLINGNAFVTKWYGFPPKSGVSCSYGYIDYNISQDQCFRVSGYNAKNNAYKDASVRIYINKIDIQEGVTYKLQNQKDNGAYAEYDISYNNASISSIGELTIARFDITNSIASGTFWFDTVNDKGEKVEIRKGRFDAKML